MNRVLCRRGVGLWTLLDLTAFADDSPTRSRESFNTGWKFARFGPMADGSTRPEPGAERFAYTATASTEELTKGNVAQHAIDGDPETRWCASGGGLGEWLMLDLGSALPVEAIEVDWEFPELDYAFVVEWSNEGQAWNRLAEGKSRGTAKRMPIAASSRFLRIRATELPNDKWASIREIRLLDGDGKLIKNRTLPGGGTPAAIEFDDSTWRALNVPHDWGVEGPFRDDLPGDTGKLPWKGIGWYRKHFNVPASDQGKRLFIDFDGAMADARVWLNGQYVGTWPYGYQPFRLELTPFVKFGAENVLAVRLDTA